MARPDQEPSELSEDKQLVDELYNFLKGGGALQERFSSFPSDSIEDNIVPIEELAPASELDRYKEIFIAGLKYENIKKAGQRHVAEEIRNHFPHWREQMIRGLGSNDPFVNKLKELTLKDIAVYTQQQFELWQKKAGGAVLGSDEHNKASAKLDYWSVIDEVVTDASDPDKLI